MEGLVYEVLYTHVVYRSRLISNFLYCTFGGTSDYPFRLKKIIALHPFHDSHFPAAYKTVCHTVRFNRSSPVLLLPPISCPYQVPNLHIPVRFFHLFIFPLLPAYIGYIFPSFFFLLLSSRFMIPSSFLLVSLIFTINAPPSICYEFPPSFFSLLINIVFSYFPSFHGTSLGAAFWFVLNIQPISSFTVNVSSFRFSFANASFLPITDTASLLPSFSYNRLALFYLFNNCLLPYLVSFPLNNPHKSSLVYFLPSLSLIPDAPLPSPRLVSSMPAPPLFTCFGSYLVNSEQPALYVTATSHRHPHTNTRSQINPMEHLRLISQAIDHCYTGFTWSRAMSTLPLPQQQQH